MSGLKRYEWKYRLRPVLRILALVALVEGGIKVAEAYSASPLPRILALISTTDTSVSVNPSKQATRQVKVRYSDYDPYAGNRTTAEREEVADAPAEETDALPLPVGVDNLPPPKLPKAERRCLAEAVYFEGRNETIEGQIAVAQVILNRVRSGNWPSTICAVVRQGRGDSCQFPAVCKAGDRPPENDASWQRAAWIADDTAAGRAWLNELTEATHYHNASAKPPWRLSMRLIRKVGWRLYYADPKHTEKLVGLAPGQAPIEVKADKVAALDAAIAKKEAEDQATAAADAKRRQRERLAENRSRLAEAEAAPGRAKSTAAASGAPKAGSASKTTATEIFARMER
jgi:spore germination cell wall hydrolase CwlJ-like protein